MHGLSISIIMSYSKLLYFIYFFGFPVSLFRVISIIILIYFSRPLSHSLIIIYICLKFSRNLHVYFIITLLFSHNLWLFTRYYFFSYLNSIILWFLLSSFPSLCSFRLIIIIVSLFFVSLHSLIFQFQISHPLILHLVISTFFFHLKFFLSYFLYFKEMFTIILNVFLYFQYCSFIDEIGIIINFSIFLNSPESFLKVIIIPPLDHQSKMSSFLQKVYYQFQTQQYVVMNPYDPSFHCSPQVSYTISQASLFHFISFICWIRGVKFYSYTLSLYGQIII